MPRHGNQGHRARRANCTVQLVSGWLLMSCVGLTEPCTDGEFFGTYENRQDERQTLVMDSPAFTRHYPDGRDIGGFDLCPDNRVIFRVGGRERNGAWSWSRNGNWLVRWVGAFSENENELTLSDGSKWRIQ